MLGSGSSDSNFFILMNRYDYICNMAEVVMPQQSSLVAVVDKTNRTALSMNLDEEDVKYS